MVITVDGRDPTPIFVQISQGIISALARGDFSPGEGLPSVRQLAREVLVNPNTVARAYRDIVRKGLAESRRGMGLFVTQGAKKKARALLAKYLRERLETVLKQCSAAGMGQEELARIIRKVLGESSPLVEEKGR